MTLFGINARFSFKILNRLFDCACRKGANTRRVLHRQAKPFYAGIVCCPFAYENCEYKNAVHSHHSHINAFLVCCYSHLPVVLRSLRLTTELPMIRYKRPMAEFDDDIYTSGHTTDDGRFLVAWPRLYNFLFSIDLIDLYRGEKT